MVVVLANEIPPAVRGRMKLWFVEPRPNVFVSGIVDSVANNVIEYLLKSCSENSGLLVFQKISKTPGFKIYGKGSPTKEITYISGFQLIIDKYMDNK